MTIVLKLQRRALTTQQRLSQLVTKTTTKTTTTTTPLQHHSLPKKLFAAWTARQVRPTHCYDNLQCARHACACIVTITSTTRKLGCQIDQHERLDVNVNGRSTDFKNKESTFLINNMGDLNVYRGKLGNAFWFDRRLSTCLKTCRRPWMNEITDFFYWKIMKTNTKKKKNRPHSDKQRAVATLRCTK